MEYQPPPIELGECEEALEYFGKDEERFLAEVASFIRTHAERLIPLLDNYCADIRGSVTEADIVDGSLEIDADGSGNFRASFGEDAHHGCADANRWYDHERTLKVTYSPQSAFLVVT